MEQHTKRPVLRNLVLPTTEETAARLRSNSGATCSSSQPSTPEHSPLLDWRDIARLSQRQHSSNGASMLTDSFGQVHAFALGRRMHACMAGAMLTFLTLENVAAYRRMHTYLRVSLTERCNLRCMYCMPEDGVELTPSRELLTTEEIMRLV